MLHLGAEAEKRFPALTATATRLMHVATDIQRDARAAAQDAAAVNAAPRIRPLAVADLDLVDEAKQLVMRVDSLEASVDVKKATLNEIRYLAEASLKRLSRRKIVPLHQEQPRAEAAAAVGPEQQLQLFRPARETHKSKRARAGAVLTAAETAGLVTANDEQPPSSSAATAAPRAAASLRKRSAKQRSDDEYECASSSDTD